MINLRRYGHHAATLAVAHAASARRQPASDPAEKTAHRAAQRFGIDLHIDIDLVKRPKFRPVRSAF
ncbi:hypothetical protein [Burkholderia sp. GS2Y]|uniref:Uncharacterized protein n=1 Tax=Burkholderia theae TaxID=3143496 RepID=A0ABU9WAU9_9BURK